MTTDISKTGVLLHLDGKLQLVVEGMDPVEDVFVDAGCAAGYSMKPAGAASDAPGCALWFYRWLLAPLMLLVLKGRLLMLLLALTAGCATGASGTSAQGASDVAAVNFFFAQCWCFNSWVVSTSGVTTGAVTHDGGINNWLFQFLRMLVLLMLMIASVI